MSEPRPSSSSDSGREPRRSICSPNIWRKTWIPTKEAWARWERTDTLALLRRFDDTVEAQRDFYAWAKQRLEPHCLLRVMYDGTQALAWWASGRLDAWLAIVHELRAAVPVNEGTRSGWFQLNRTEVRVLEQDERIDDALAAADRVGALADRFRRGIRLRASGWKRIWRACPRSRAVIAARSSMPWRTG